MCPGAAFDDAQRQFSVTTASGIAGCVSWGTGNIGGHDGDIGTGWTFVDKQSTDAEDPLPFAITGAGETSGWFFVEPTLWTQYSQLAVAFKTGNNMNPSWAAFALPFGTLSGWWDIGSNGLSHANLYASGLLGSDGNPLEDEPIAPGGDGGPPASSVAMPEPATLLLFGSGLFGAVALRRRMLKVRPPAI